MKFERVAKWFIVRTRERMDVFPEGVVLVAHSALNKLLELI
nr:MAG TPA: hypothetical protein [Bacteriophage sp.]